MSSFRILRGSGMRGARARASDGFAYIWTLLLVAFMGVSLVIASDLYATSQRRDKERELIFIGHEFRAAIERFHESGAAGKPQYPQSFEELLRDSRFPNARRHLRRMYTDPMTGKNTWGTKLVEGRIVAVYSLSTQQPIKQDGFEPADEALRGKQQYADWVFAYPPELFAQAGSTPGAPPGQPGQQPGTPPSTLPPTAPR
ncbi:MAG: type II secretion system protein [Pseudomonadota bacterium]